MKRLAMTAACSVSLVALTGTALAGGIDPIVQDVLDKAGPDEVVSTLVYLVDQVDLDALSDQLNQEGARRRERHETVILALQDAANRSQGDLLGTLDAMRGVGSVERYEPYWITNCIRVDAIPAAIELIAADPSVDWVYPNWPIELMEPVEAGEEVEPPQGRTPEPGLVAIRAPEVWSLGYTGQGVLVATLDTGVDGNHPALASRWRGLDPEYAGHPEWAWYDPVTFTTFPQAFGSHGTHTMGTVCGGEPGDQVGVAPGAQWIHAAVIDRVSLEQTISDAILAFQWMVDPDGNPGTIFDVPRVCSNSWRIASYHNVPPYNEPCNDGFWAYLDGCEAAGTVILFSAGNEGPSPETVGRPPDRATDEYRTCAVAAVDANDPAWPIAGFSSRGPTYCTPDGSEATKPDISGPGVDVRSSVPGAGYAEYSGTSMASPHINGVVALMYEACPDLTVEDVKQIIYDTAVDLGAPGEDNSYGYGMVDALEAVVLAESLCGPSPPRAFDGYYETGVDEPLGIELVATDYDGEPGGPLTYRILSLPTGDNTLTDAGNGHVITPGELPYDLVDNGSEVTYTPVNQYYGTDSFEFAADDGGDPPDGGEGEPALISVLVMFGPPQIVSDVLPDGTLNVPYGPVQVEVEQGQPELTFSVVSNEYVEEDLGENQFEFVGEDQNWNSDDNSWLYSLPFSFPYYGEDETSVWVCSNGFIDFDSSSSPWTNSTEDLIANRRIAPLWDDWMTSCEPENDIYIDESVPGEVTIRWDVQHYFCSDDGDFSVTLVNDGTIRFNYGPTNTGLTPTIGVSAGDGANYTISQYDGASSLTNANTVEIYPPSGMPEGLELSTDGMVSGTPIESGLFQPRVRVVDALDRSDVRQLTLEILEGGGPGDVNGDGVVNIVDLLLVFDAWGPCPGCPEDVNGDGVVNVLDILLLFDNWG